MATTEQVLSEYPTAQIVRYSDGGVQVVINAARPEWGEVVTYSDGGQQTTINVV